MSDSELLSAALRYAELNWYIFPLRKIIRLPDGSVHCSCRAGAKCTAIGKHPAIKWSKEATCDPVTVRRWWGNRFAGCGIGCATGPSGLVVADADGPTGVLSLAGLLAGERLTTARAKTARGYHVFTRGEAPTSSDPVTKLDVRSTGGFVVLAPSPHASGHVYSWEAPPWDDGQWGDGLPVEMFVAGCPPAMLDYARKKKPALRRGVGSEKGTSSTQTTRKAAPGEVAGAGLKLPEYLACASEDFGDRLGAILEAVDWHEVARALACIPPDCDRNMWRDVGFALHSTQHAQAYAVWDKWSSFGGKLYKGPDDTAAQWRSFKIIEGGITLRTLFDLAFRHGYKRGRSVTMGENTGRGQNTDGGQGAGPQAAAEPEPHAKGVNGHTINPAASEFFAQFTSESDNPLIRLNKEFAVIEDWGGKCRVLSWVPSPIDRGVKVPSFQDFKSFSERFANKYVTVKKTKHLKDGDVDVDEDVQLGAQWLRWTGRRTYRHLELAPNQPAELANGNFNLWQGWGVMPAAGRWDRMRDHIGEILAGGNGEAADYILKWAAWCVQHPEAAALVALVLRGGKGVGKGLFFTSLRAIFGAHGLQIFNRSHLVGSFNAHLRNCLFLFADEAFWAGDKQGESVLKGLITEPIVVIEQKGVDGVAWPNRLKVGMAANARWVVPASADERRYAVFDVVDARQQDLTYFGAIHDELKAGGLAAMLWDLLTLELGAWSPMMIPHTKALQDQKDLSMSPLVDWWHGLLSGDGDLWFETTPKEWPANKLLQEVKEAMPWLRVSAKGLANFIKERGATNKHTRGGSIWTFPKIGDARAKFEKQFGSREWEISLDRWGQEK